MTSETKGNSPPARAVRAEEKIGPGCERRIGPADAYKDRNYRARPLVRSRRSRIGVGRAAESLTVNPPIDRPVLCEKIARMRVKTRGDTGAHLAVDLCTLGSVHVAEAPPFSGEDT